MSKDRKQIVRAPISDDLRGRIGAKKARVRKGDSVKILRGEYSGLEAKVTSVDLRTGRLAVEGVTREKIRGGTVPVKVHSSKVMITGLILDDLRRRKRLQTKDS